MKRVTRNNIWKYIEMKKQYKITKDSQLLQEINRFTNEVINKDRKYYSKLKSYGLGNNELKYCM